MEQDDFQKREAGKQRIDSLCPDYTLMWAKTKNKDSYQTQKMEQRLLSDPERLKIFIRPPKKE